MKSPTLAICALILVQGAHAQPSAAVFAPGVVSTSAHEGPFAFTPDGKTLYFVRLAAGMLRPGLFVSHQQAGRWGEPKQIAFPEGASAAPFSLSPDGAKIYCTHSPDSQNRSRLWVADRDAETWKNARPLGGALAKWDGDQASPSVTSDGTLYFTSNRPGGSGGWDIYRSALRNGEYREPELMGGGRNRRISTAHDEAGVAAARDGSFLVFSSKGARNGFGASDLYIVDLSAEGWSAWVWNLGPLVNSPVEELDPSLSPDNKHLYFSRAGDIYEIDLDAVRRPPAESAVWKTRTEVPLPRNWPQAVVANGRIYVYGGLTGGFATGRPERWVHEVDVYDPANSTWSSLPPAPDGWKQATLASMDNRLFLFRRGGPGVAEYRPGSNRWEIKAPASDFALPEGWPSQTRTVVLGRKAYTYFAVDDSTRTFTYFVEYDFETGKWTPKAAMPSPAPQLVVFDGRIYGFGDDVSVYDPQADKWTIVAPIAMPRLEAAVVAYKDEIWVIGGHGLRAEGVDGDISPTVVRYNPRLNTWSPGPAYRTIALRAPQSP